jgi:uncharacterized membrane protein
MDQSILGIILILLGFALIMIVRKWEAFLSWSDQNWVDRSFYIIGKGRIQKIFSFLFGLFCIVVGFLIIFGIIDTKKDGIKREEVIQKEASEEELITKLGLKREFYHGIKVLANEDNQYLIKQALKMMEEKTPEYFRFVADDVKEIRQSKRPFTMGPVRSVEGTDRVEFSNFSGQYSKYSVACFLVHEATHIIDRHKGLPYTKETEIRAREAEIAFLRTLGEAEGGSFEKAIKFTENEIDMIKKGVLYGKLPEK